MLSEKNIKVSAAEFNAFQRYIYTIAGISLTESKTYLLEGRLCNLLKEYHCSSYSELLELAESDRSKALEQTIIDQIATHETYFFRDMAPFQLLKYKILPDLIDKRTITERPPRIPINIWSAACSTGQEVYSIAIVLKELLPDIEKYSIRLLGTDISDAVVAKASYGTYNTFEVERGLSSDQLDKYFFHQGDQWKIRDDIRGMVQFTKLNLMKPLQALGKFDIIFCRNIAVYFSKKDRELFFNKVADQLNPDGYLIIGATESMFGISTCFVPREHLRSVYYMKELCQ
jgi:chemotaxis protein methyltransferase CheR